MLGKVLAGFKKRDVQTEFMVEPSLPVREHTLAKQLVGCDEQDLASLLGL